MKPKFYEEAGEILKIISKDRTRTNLLKNLEQKTLAYLVQRIPAWMNSNMLTLLGFAGSLIVVLGFILAAYLNKNWLLIALPGFAINWFGDSLDGRLAYFRKLPRKWYGFALDLTVDWLTTILIGFGYIVYSTGFWDLAGFGFVVFYGWAMITALLRYKITGKYVIDSGVFGPTEVRIIISLILLAEVLFTDAILYAGVISCVLLFLVNIIETRKLLHQADELDKSERGK